LATRKAPPEPSFLFRRPASSPAEPTLTPKPAAPPPGPAKREPPAPIRIEDRDIATAEGIGPKRADALRNRDIATFGDAALHLPYRYKDLRRRDRIADLRPGMDAVIEGQLENFKQRPLRGSRIRSLASAVFRDHEKHVIDVAWFPAVVVVRRRAPGGTASRLDFYAPEQLSSSCEGHP
jgi:hypothetical protein